MDLYELFNTPIDELYERGILPEPEIERNKRMMTLSIKCSLCNGEYTAQYTRQNPDRLALQMNCPDCGSYTWVLESATPYTSFYRSRAVEHASFCDDISGQCWHCGRAHDLIPHTFSNGVQVTLCPKHFKRYHKDMFLLRLKHVPGSHIEGFIPRPHYSNWDEW